MSEVPQDHSQFPCFPRKTRRIQLSWTHGYDLLVRLYEEQQQRGKVHGATSRGNQSQAAKSLLSGQSERTCLMTQQWSGTQHVNCFLDWGAHQSLSAHGFHWRFIIETPDCLAHAKMPDFQRNVNVHHKPYCLHGLVTLSHVYWLK